MTLHLIKWVIGTDLTHYLKIVPFETVKPPVTHLT
jgi:hypothetical protein